MIIFLSGPDDYRREAHRQFYVEEFLKRHPKAPIEKFDIADEEAFARCGEFLRGQSLFDRYRMAILENGLAPGKEIKRILAPLNEEKKTIVLISDPDRAPKTLAFLEEPPVTHKEFPYLEGAAWAAFVKETAEREDVALSPDALSLIARAYQKDTWRMVTEMQKIAGVSRGRISLGDLEALGVEETPFFWGIIQGLKGSDLRTRLSSLERLFSMGEPPAKLFNMLASLWIQKTPLFAKGDVLVKTGKLDYEEVLADLVMS